MGGNTMSGIEFQSGGDMHGCDYNSKHSAARASQRSVG
jgi:hypothetical protein